jgi:2-keto-4-pentenoate hydratase/2-oxohepta-3-ene-1,7-dioic acid hydratase in catechol pathway
MKLVRYGEPGQEQPGLIDAQGVLRDLSAHVDDIAGAALGANELSRLRGLPMSVLPAVPGTPRLGPCVGRVGKMICVGLNYSDHAAESGMAVPTEPVLFTKATSAIIGCNDAVVLPRDSVKSDWEVELGVVIGRRASYLASDAEAADCIAGYVLSNDVSEREYQLEHSGPQWSLGKSCPTFNPVGPWLVPAAAVEADDIRLASWVNDEVRQDSSTADMVFGPAELVRRLSQYMVLEPGDLITTGTPEGVALSGRFPYLKAGDVMRMSGGDLLGGQRQRLVQA